MPDVRRLVPLALLAGGCLLLAGVRPQRAAPVAAPLREMPLPFAGYATTDLELDTASLRVAAVSDYVMRSFARDSSEAFSVYVGFYEMQSQGRSIHSPKNCLPGAGWEIVETRRTMLGAAAGAPTVNRVLLDNAGDRALVYYWYQGRGRVTASEYAVKWNLLRDAALTGRSEEALVRIVVPIRARDAAALASADALARDVAGRLIPEVRRALPPAPA